MESVNVSAVVERNLKHPVSYDSPWIKKDIVNNQLLKCVLQTLIAAGRPHSHFFIAAEELRLPLYDQLATEPVDWCDRPVALGIRYVQWRLMNEVCSYFGLKFPVGEGTSKPPSQKGAPDYTYTARFQELEARKQAKRCRKGRRVSRNIQRRLLNEIKTPKTPPTDVKQKRTTETSKNLSREAVSSRIVVPKGTGKREPASRRDHA
ncbi:hypothetical protein V2A60_000852 [Cordyceps javanica]